MVTIKSELLGSGSGTTGSTGSSMANQTNHTRVTLKKIPTYPDVKILDEVVNRNKTWLRFFKRFGVQLDPACWVVYNKSRKVSSYLDKPVAHLLDGLYRKASVTIHLVRLKQPVNDRRAREVGAMSPSMLDHRRRVSEAVAGGPVPPPGRGAAHPRASSRNTRRFPEDDMRIPGEPSPPRLVRQQPNVANNAPYNADSEDDDNMSQLSQGDDDMDEHGAGADLKAQLIQAVQAVPAVHFMSMRTELVQLKNSGEGRDYKWIHYAPRTSGWVLSAFKV